MGRASGLPLLKFDPKDEERAKLEWMEVKLGDMSGGSLLAAFEVYLVRSFSVNLKNVAILRLIIIYLLNVIFFSTSRSFSQDKFTQ